MKVDFNSVLYILGMVLLLGLSLLGRKRKKPVPGIPGLKFTPPGKDPSKEIYLEEEPARVSSDPFIRLEQMFSQEAYSQDTEGQSLEIIVDEEEEILKEKEAWGDSKTLEKITGEATRTTSPPLEMEIIGGIAPALDLFRNADDLVKAVIYSEILSRKEY